MGGILRVLESDANSNDRLNLHMSSSRPNTNVVAGMGNVPHRLTSLNMETLVDSAVWGSYEAFGRCSLSGGSMSLGVGLESL